jgi:hypothetical protein
MWRTKLTDKNGVGINSKCLINKLQQDPEANILTQYG